MIIFGHILPLLIQAYYYEAARVVTKIGLSLKPNHHDNVKLVQISTSRTVTYFF
jgi:hypothetical protein